MLWPLAQAKFYRMALALKRLDTPGLRAQTALHGVLELRYEHHQPQSEKTSYIYRSCPLIRNTSCGGVDNEVPQLLATLSEPLD